MVTLVLNRLGSLTYFRLSKRDFKRCSLEAGGTPERFEFIFLSPFRVDAKFNCKRGDERSRFQFFCEGCFFRYFGLPFGSPLIDRKLRVGPILGMTQRWAGSLALLAGVPIWKKSIGTDANFTQPGSVPNNARSRGSH
jgi:hypothetical protein